MPRAPRSNVPLAHQVVPTLLTALKGRAKWLAAARAFFAARAVMEVQTPLLGQYTVTDPYLVPFSSEHAGKPCYLQTSPEYAMKRLLAAGSGCLYQLGAAYRNEEQGRLHNGEFTLLEWYRVGFTHQALMQEMDVFLQTVCGWPSAEYRSYVSLFADYCDVDITSASVSDLRAVCQNFNLNLSFDCADVDTLLQCLMSHVIEPKLGQSAPVFVYDYPASQAALAIVRNESYPVAERFELYYHGIELANGYHELCDVDEHRRRFARDNARRTELGLPVVTPDPRFLACLPSLPACAGVALGVDRVLMLMLGATHLNEVLAFDFTNA
jgi:lysyl-tRNA synthetase class 2